MDAGRLPTKLSENPLFEAKSQPWSTGPLFSSSTRKTHSWGPMRTTSESVGILIRTLFSTFHDLRPLNWCLRPVFGSHHPNHHDILL